MRARTVIISRNRPYCPKVEHDAREPGRYHSPMRIAAVLFDLDGTLLDTEHYIFGAFEHALVGAGCRPGTFDEYRQVVGLPLEQCYLALAPGAEAGALCEAHRQWQTQHLELVRPMPGAAQVLQRLRAGGIRIAVVTNRSARSSVASLEQGALLPLVDTVVSHEDVARQKPDPEPVRLALARLGVAPAEAVMVGDTAVDVIAGRNAGTHTVAVTFGFAGPRVAETAPDGLISHLDQLPGLLSTLNGAARRPQ
jgi:HAD superfamily hydrolase (TIGR01509 family)